MLSNDDAAPVDRPNLSKDYLAGNAPEDWIPLRGDDFYAENGIDLRLKANVAAHRCARPRSGAGGRRQGRLRPAAARDRRRAGAPADSRRRTSRTSTRCAPSPTAARSSSRPRRRKRAVVIGASFIGLEVAASLRARGIEVHVVAPEKRPMERILGPEMGDFVRALHEEHGVVFHLEDTVAAHRRQAGHAEERRHARGRSRGRGRRRAAAPGAGREGRARRSIAASSSTPSWRPARRNLRRRRHRALARSAQRAGDPRRALGGRRAPGPDRGAQHARPAREVRRRAVLLEPALRRADQLCRPCREVGRARGRRRHRRQGTAWCATSSAARTLAVASIFRDVASLQAEVAMERQEHGSASPSERARLRPRNVKVRSATSDGSPTIGGTTMADKKGANGKHAGCAAANGSMRRAIRPWRRSISSAT